MRALSAVGLAAILSGLVPGLVSPAGACSCIAEPYENKLSKAELIVVGTVTDVQFEGAIDEAIASTPPNTGQPAEGVVGKLSVAVDQYLKGEGAPNLIVEQDGSGGVYVYKKGDEAELLLEGGPNCRLFSGIPIGERYLMFLNRADSGDYATSGGCSGSAHDFTQETLDRITQMLANPTSLPETGGWARKSGSPGYFVIVLGCTLTTLGLGSLLLTRRSHVHPRR